jgi:two-component system capsular synthesis sensor histidine kinase RcsC
LRQIIANLLNNALKFTEVGRISLYLDVLEQNHDQVRVRWQVSDTGIGIPLAKQAHLFEPFYQVPGSAQEGGAGLGLSICASLSELMGGNLRVVSEHGLGSRFILDVPLTILADEPAARRPASAANSPLNLRALVAEDNPINRAILDEQLSAMGIRVVTAANGEEALQRWQQGVFDLVITDVNMPRLNGYELASRLRASGVTVPIIGVTANALREEGQHCLAVGMDAWVVKPLSLDNLRAILLRVCPQAETALESESESESESEPASSLPAAALDLSHMSASLFSLFVVTMTQDLADARKALSAGDGPALTHYLHRMSGAYGVVHAATLADQCCRLETLIAEQGLSPALAARVDALLQQLLDGLPSQPF